MVCIDNICNKNRSWITLPLQTFTADIWHPHQCHSRVCVPCHLHYTWRIINKTSVVLGVCPRCITLLTAVPLFNRLWHTRSFTACVCVCVCSGPLRIIGLWSLLAAWSIDWFVFFQNLLFFSSMNWNFYLSFSLLMIVINE